MPEMLSKSTDVKETSEKKDVDETSENYKKIKPEGKISEKEADSFWSNLFKKQKAEKLSLETKIESIKDTASDQMDNKNSMDETKSDNSNEFDIEKTDPVLEKMEKSIGTPEGIKTLIENHPEKAELWNRQLEVLDTLNDPDASPAEIRSAQAKLSILKGQLLETAVKDVLVDVGFEVEAQQRVVEGESGGTRPDAIAKNNTDRPIEVFGVTIQPGETLCVECKCGGSSYMANQLNDHIPNQLSGQEGTKILLTTSDIKETPTGLANHVCEKYGANLVVLDASVNDVENAIKEVSGE